MKNNIQNYLNEKLSDITFSDESQAKVMEKIKILSLNRDKEENTDKVTKELKNIEKSSVIIEKVEVKDVNKSMWIKYISFAAAFLIIVGSTFAFSKMDSSNNNVGDETMVTTVTSETSETTSVVTSVKKNKVIVTSVVENNSQVKTTSVIETKISEKSKTEETQTSNQQKIYEDGEKEMYSQKNNIEVIQTTNSFQQNEWIDYQEKVNLFIRSEKVNGISIETKIDDVKSILGEPNMVSEELYHERDKVYVQWFYYNKLQTNENEWETEIMFERINGIQYVREVIFNIDASTSSGVGIGSSRDQIITAYIDYGLTTNLEFVPFEEREKVTIYNKYPLQIGHWKYGGMMFEFDDNDMVSSIKICSGTSM